MTPTELKAYIMFKLNIESSDFSEMLSVVNVEMDNLSGKITKAREHFFGVYGNLNLSADVREYPLYTDILNNIIAVFLKLDGTNLVRVKVMDLNDYITDPSNRERKKIVYQESWITEHFNNEDPYIIKFKDSLFILSGTITDVTSGIQIWYLKYPPHVPALTGTTDLSIATDVSDTMRFPTQFHELLARAVIINYKETNKIALVEKELLFEKDLEEKISLLRPMNLDEVFAASTPYDDGQDY